MFHPGYIQNSTFIGCKHVDAREHLTINKSRKSTAASLTDELGNRVVFALCAYRPCDAVVLQDREEQLNKVRCVGRRNHIQHLNKNTCWNLKDDF